jgi:hypothetical protein
MIKQLSRAVPVALVAHALIAQSPSEIRRVSMSATQACALLVTGRVACWYWADGSQDATGEFVVPTHSPPGLPSMRAIAVGGSHACGVSSTDGAVWCWGSNSLGQLGMRGDGGATPKRVPSKLAFADVTAGKEHTCALTDEQQAWCWGDQWEGSTGTMPTGETVRDPSPVRGSRRFVQVSAGTRHTCGVTTNNEPACWGDNSTGAIRSDGWRTFFSPVHVREIGTVRRMYSGAGTSCALRADSSAVCWGSSAVQPPSDDRSLVFSELALTGTAVCGVRRAQDVYCWRKAAGGGASGVGVRFRGEPVVARAIVGAGSRVCALTPASDLVCWDPSDGSAPRRVRLVIAN